MNVRAPKLLVNEKMPPRGDPVGHALAAGYRAAARVSIGMFRIVCYANDCFSFVVCLFFWRGREAHRGTTL